MSWLADILKNLAVSRILVASVFITATVMYFGPIMVPNHVPKLQDDYIPYLFGAMCLSGTILFFWFLGALWSAVKRIAEKLVQLITDFMPLSEIDSDLIFAMSQNPTQPLNLNRIDYSHTLGTKLEYHQLTHRLEKKGLISINQFDDNIVTLTERGRKKALLIQRRTNNSDIP